ncbi:tape measure protein [Acinetobacter phage JeffCo]|nr:tape measure protein [Acinetobacter phage JeffCo]
MADLADLVIRFSSQGAKKVIGEIDNVNSSGSSATSSLKKIAGAAALATAAIAGIGYAAMQIKDATVKFESLQAGISTAVGSATEAQEVFKILQDFATNTPYDIEKVTTAFTQLVNYGLTPSERALKSYGNTASAMRKDISQMVEAVADAVTGEFERLKEFGIKSKVEGDNIVFTFRGVKTEVKNNAEEIEKYLIELGENNFGDAMEAQSKTLGGAISAMGSAWENMWYTVGQLGFDEAIADGISFATDGINTVTGMLASGEIEAYLDVIGTYFEGTFSDMSQTAQTVGAWMSEVWANHGDTVMGVIAYIADEFMSIPNACRYYIQQATIVVAAFVDKMVAYGQAIRAALNPFDDVSIKGAAQGLKTNLGIIKESKEASIQASREEYGAFKQKTQAAIAEAKKLTAERLKGSKAVKSSEDRLAKYAIKPPKATDDKDGKKGGKAASNGAKKAADKAKQGAEKAAREAERERERALQEFERLKESLETGTETAEREYKARNDIIMKSTAAGSAQRSELMKRSEEKYADDLHDLRTTGELASLQKTMMTEEQIIEQSYAERNRIIERYASQEDKGTMLSKSKEMYDKEQQELADRREQSRQSLMEGLISEEQEIINSYERRRQEILKATELTEIEKGELTAKLAEQHKANLNYTMLSQVDTIASAMSMGLSEITGMLADAGKESNFLYKAMIMAQKAAAIPQMIIATEMGAAKALELGPIAGPPLSMAVRALGYAGIGTVIGTSIAGLFDRGGMVPSGKYGIVGERGPELVKGPAIVTSRQQTAGMAGSRGTGNQVNVTVHNNAPVKVETTTDRNGDIQMVIEEVVKRAEKAIAGGISRGEGDVTKAMQGSFGLKRGGV